MPTTTKMGIVYPSSTDLVKDGATAMGTISTTVDSKTGLVLLSTTTISAVSSTSAPANTFNANYENYLVLVNLTANSANDGDIYLRLRSGSSDQAASYYWGRRGWTSLGAGTDGSGSNSSAIVVMTMDAGNTGNQHIQLNIFSPFLSQKTKASWIGTAQTDTGVFYGQFGGAFLDNTTSYDSFSLVNQNGTSTGKMTVYGYNF